MVTPTTYTYIDNFGTGTSSSNLDGATSTATAGAGLEKISNPAAGNSGNEYALFTGANENATLTLPNVGLTGNQYVQSFNASMNLTIKGTSGTFGNHEPDGVSFNFGGTPTGTSAEQGTDTGLSVDIIPYSYDGTDGNVMQIKWNGTVIGSESLNNTGSSSSGTTGVFQIGVDAAGDVTTSWHGVTVTGTIPAEEWSSTSQSNFNFDIAGRTGANVGTAYVDNVNLQAKVVCFARGTVIATETGPRRIEDLRPGDSVVTVDNGHQPIRWIGASRVPAQGSLAPIRIRAGVLGNTRPLIVSPHHRLLISSWRAELLFGEVEVLVPAKALVDDHAILRQEGGYVDYFHILFDRHELIYAEGAIAESLFLGREGLLAISDEARQEVETLFPELAETGDVASVIATRRILTGAESRVLQTGAA